MEGFAELFAEETVKRDKLVPGQKYSVAVVSKNREWVFVDLGGKSEGMVAASEFLDEEGHCSLQDGDSLELYFLSEKNNEKLFTSQMSGSVAQAHLAEAFHNAIPVQGTVESEIKGGFQIRLGGNTRAFCPFSQIDLRKSEDNQQHIGQCYSFIVSQWQEGGRNIVVSRRRLLEKERQEKKALLRETLNVGDKVRGRISSVQSFGAFVDIGGIEGLIPASEISWGHVDDIHSCIEPGREVEVLIKKLDWEADRFSFSLKDTLPDPWQQAEVLLPEGSTQRGRVVRLTDFGAFISLAEGIDGLIHISKLGAGRRINHPREVLGTGDEIEVQIESVDSEKRRISLSPVFAQQESLSDEELQSEDGEKKEGLSAEPRQRRRGGKVFKSKDNRPEDNREEFKSYQASAKKTKPSMGTLGDLLSPLIKNANKPEKKPEKS